MAPAVLMAAAAAAAAAATDGAASEAAAMRPRAHRQDATSRAVKRCRFKRGAATPESCESKPLLLLLLLLLAPVDRALLTREDTARERASLSRADRSGAR